MRDTKSTNKRRSTTRTSAPDPGIKRLAGLIKDIRIAMLATVDDQGVLRSRPMATLEAEFSGELWFFTSQETGKVGDISHYKQVNVSYVSPGGDRYVSVMGSADLVHDVFKMKTLWHPMLKVWFPDGLNDPELRLIRVTVEQAEFWDAKDGRLGSWHGILRNLAAGVASGGDNKEIMLEEVEEV